jgi:hypothetical protein
MPRATERAAEGALLIALRVRPLGPRSETEDDRGACMPYLIIAHDHPGMDVSARSFARLIAPTSRPRAQSCWYRVPSLAKVTIRLKVAPHSSIPMILMRPSDLKLKIRMLRQASENPVALPPGWARLSTIPAPTGGRRLNQGVEHSLEIERRAANNLEHICGRGLLLPVRFLRHARHKTGKMRTPQ